MHIVEEHVNKITVLKVSGKIDAVSADNLGAYITTKIEHGYIYFIIDCECVEFLSSSGMRTFLLAIQALEKVHGTIYFSSFGSNIKKILSLAGIDKYLKIFSTLAEAKKSLNK